MAATTIAQEITRLTTAKANLKTSIEGKGVTVPSSTLLDGYSALVDQIQQGGGEEAPENDVNFYDYDGFRVASYTITEAKALTALPTPPSHEGLTFQQWNWTLNDIATYDRQYIDVGANYITTDGKTWLMVKAEENVAITLRGAKASVVVEWGDGTTSSYNYTSNNSNYSFLHTYESAGYYTIKITATPTADGGYVGFFNLNNTTTSGWFGVEWQEIRCGNYLDFSSQGTLANITGTFCSLSIPTTSITALNVQFSLFRAITIPRGSQLKTSYQNFAYFANSKICFPKEIKSFAQTGSGYAIYQGVFGRLVVPNSTDVGDYETNSFQSVQISLISLPIGSTFKTLANGQYINTNRLRYIDIAQGWIPNQNMTFSNSTLWSAENMVKFFTKLGTTQTAITLTFGSTNLNKLTAEQKAIATDKGYTLA